ncbi:glycosyl hydrolase family 18 protein [Pseudoneobacillus sp. C159]
MKKFILSLFLFGLILFPSSYSEIDANSGLFNMSYIYFGSPSTYVGQVNKTKGSLHVVSPNYFDVNDKGELEVTWKLQTSFINEMHRRGVKVVPFLANHWHRTAGINGLLNREKLARDIADAIEQYNLDGVNVDIEGVGADYRNDHNEFIRLLREKIPKAKEVSVSVAANPNNYKTGWHGFYDYKTLSNYADYLMIMAYDESWEAPDSPIGPVASLSFSERSIQYAINQGVPKNKIVYGMPFYGRLWKLDGPTTEGHQVTGRGLSSTRVNPLVSKFNGTYYFEEKSQTPYATFTIPKNQYEFVGTLKLTEGNYVIWYENERSLKAKLRLPTKYQIKGTGSWALYHETEDTWDYYTRWLNQRFFTDVPNGFWAENEIMHVSTKGWMNGRTNTSFAPGSSLTRAQAAQILVRSLGYEDVTPSNYQFSDTVKHNARREIEVARELGMVRGVSPTRFDPNAPVTRAQLASMLNNIFKYAAPSDEISPFTDVTPNNSHYNNILAISQQGFLTGYKEGTFRPGANSTRAQMAALMTRMSDNFEVMKRQ